MVSSNLLEKQKNHNIDPVPDMAAFYDLIINSEEWLMNRILNYAKLRGYSKYTSTLMEAWRLSISGLSDALVTAIMIGSEELELSPEEDYSNDPVSAFGILEANRHRERGVDLGMFLGLMKYYRQSYMDLVEQAGFDKDYEKACKLIIERFFDRVEVGFCVEWTALTENEKTKELRSKNRRITNEKNKYLTIFETIQDPVILLDEDNRIENVNYAWSELFEDDVVPGALYYNQNPTENRAFRLAEELLHSINSNEKETVIEDEIETKNGPRFFQIKIKRMLDISDKYKSTVIILSDITDIKKAEEEKLKKEKLQGVLEMAGAVCHEINQPLQVVMGQSQLLEMDMSKRSRYYRKVSIIANQIEKLGNMTRKLTNITRYKTKTYLNSMIIDIDKASDSNVID